MRTTLNINDKTYKVVRSLANANRQSVSRTVDQLLATALNSAPESDSARKNGSDPLTGFPVFRSKHTVTDEDINNLINEE